MFLKRLFGGHTRPAKLSADLAGEDSWRLRNDMIACLDREGGMATATRRLAAIAALYGRLSPDGRARFRDLVAGLNDDAAEATGRRYGRIEEAELFGRRASRLAIFDAFETPRRRFLTALAETPDGPALLDALAREADDDLAADIAFTRGGGAEPR